MEEAEKTAVLESAFRKLATSLDHDHPEQNDYYRWAREQLRQNPASEATFVEYVREMMEKLYGI